MAFNVSRERGRIGLDSWSQLQDEDDCALMQQLVAGNDDALAVIVDRYQRLVLSVALRIVKDVSEAEEVVQTVFLNIFRNAGKFDPVRGTLKVWLLQYAYTRSINRRHYLEQRQFYSARDLDDVGPLASTAQPLNLKGLAPFETVRLVQEALGKLNERQQIAITLVYFEGLTLAEAAGKSGVTVSALRHHYYRGLMQLRQVIKSDREAEEPSIQTEERAERIQLEVANLKPRTI